MADFDPIQLWLTCDPGGCTCLHGTEPQLDGEDQYSHLQPLIVDPNCPLAALLDLIRSGEKLRLELVPRIFGEAIDGEL